MQGSVTSGEGIMNKRAIPALAIIQGIAATGGMIIKGINALVDAKRASSFNNAIKLINENVQITHNRLITLENRTAMMAKAVQGPSFTAHNLVEVLFVVFVCIKLLGNVVRVYPRIVQGLTFLSA